MEENNILRRVCAKGVAKEFIRPVGFVKGQVIEGAIILRPFHAGPVVDTSLRARDLFGQVLSACKILDADGVNLRAFEINGVGKPGSVRADAEGAETAKLVTFGEKVLIEQNFFSGREQSFFAAIDRILFSGFRAGVIKISVVSFWDARVDFLDAPFHFLKEKLLQWFDVSERLIEIIVLSLKILQRFGILAVAHPVIFVEAGNSVLGERVLSSGRLGGQIHDTPMICRVDIFPAGFPYDVPHDQRGYGSMRGR